MTDDTQGEGYTAIILKDETLDNMAYRLKHDLEITREQRAELLTAILFERGGELPRATTD